MKVLIISITCGEGHNQIAKAVSNALTQGGAECKIMQLYGFDEKEIARKNKQFLNACKLVPHIYEKIWQNTRKKPLKSYINGVIKKCSGYLLENINAYSPDVIVCTHNEAGALVAHLSESGKINKSIKTYSIVFDYCLCPYWEYNTGLDYIIYPHETMKDELCSKGFKDEQILPFGLPVDLKYTLKEDKQKAREELGLDKNKFTVVLYSGGNCVSSAYDIIKKLLKCKTDIQIVAVCGKNEQEYKRVQKLIDTKGLKNILNYGFCTCLDKVYSAGDIVITRGGGMGVTEQINKQIPFVIREKLILNEKINEKYFVNLGLGVSLHKLGNAPKIVDRLANDEKKLADMREKAAAFSKPDATVRLVNHIMSNGK